MEQTHIETQHPMLGEQGDFAEEHRFLATLGGTRWHPKMVSGLWPIAVRPILALIFAKAVPALAQAQLGAPTPWLNTLEMVLLAGAAVLIIGGVHHALAIATTSYRLEAGGGGAASLVVASGIISRTERHLELMRIRDVTYVAPVWQRLVGCAHIRIDSTDPGDPVLILEGQRQARSKIEALKAGARAQQRILGYREAWLG